MTTTPPERAAKFADVIRRRLNDTKARLCPCGVEPMLCADHDPRKTTEGEMP